MFGVLLPVPSKKRNCRHVGSGKHPGRVVGQIHQRQGRKGFNEILHCLSAGAATAEERGGAQDHAEPGFFVREILGALDEVKTFASW